MLCSLQSIRLLTGSSPYLATRVLPGILLAVTIIYQYFETYDKEKSQGQVNLW